MSGRRPRCAVCSGSFEIRFVEGEKFRDQAAVWLRRGTWLCKFCRGRLCKRRADEEPSEVRDAA